MISFCSSTSYPSSTTAYPTLNKLLDSLVSPPFISHTPSSMSSTFTSTSIVTTLKTSAMPLPPIPSLLPTSPHSSSSFVTLPLLLQDAVATSSNLQQFSAVRQLTQDLQKIKTRHPKRPQLSPGETGTQRNV